MTDETGERGRFCQFWKKATTFYYFLDLASSSPFYIREVAHTKALHKGCAKACPEEGLAGEGTHPPPHTPSDELKSPK